MNCRLYSWHKLVFFLTSVLAPACLFAAGPVHTHVFRDEVQKKVFFNDSLYVFLDDKLQYDIWDIIHSDDIEFTPSGGQVSVVLKKKNGRAVVSISAPAISPSYC